jgi:class 3 adenylate cyclase
MSFWTQLRMPTEHELLVGFYDLAGYMRHAEKTPPQDLLATMTGYFARTGQIVGDAGGRLIKTLGDAGLVAFPAEAVDAGVLALRSVQSAGRQWLGQQGFKTSIVVKLHPGPVGSAGSAARGRRSSTSTARR